MNRSYVALIVAAPVVLVGGLVGATQRTMPQFPQPAPPAQTMPPASASAGPQHAVAQRTRWEYRVETARVGTYVRDQAPAFNSLGEDGWELCGIRGYTIQEGEQSVQISEFYFKRPVQ